MVKVLTFLAVMATAACTPSNSASGHEEPIRRALSTDQRKLFAQNTQRALAECSTSESTRKLHERAVARRAQAVEDLRQELRGRRLDGATVVTTTHVSGLTGITATTSASVLFGSTAPCVAEPELTEVIDVNTCEPVEDMYVDLWHTNSTGVYSGVVASTNGDSTDTSNVKNTFLRGVTPTNEDGVAQMISIFLDTTLAELRMFTSSGIMAFFFDQDLITSVEAVTPYSTNKQTITLNKNDNIFKEASASGYDPVMNYALLGDTVQDGIFVWISVAVDMTANRDVTAVSTLSETSTFTSTTDTNDAFSIDKFGKAAVLLAIFAPFALAIF